METSVGKPNVAALATLTLTDENLFLIGRTAHLVDDKVYIFSGELIVLWNPRWCSHWSHITDIIMAEYAVEAEHCMPTVAYGNECKQLGSPYLGKCGFDTAGEAFKQLYGSDLNKAVSPLAANLRPFSQAEFVPAARSGSLLTATSTRPRPARAAARSAACTCPSMGASSRRTRSGRPTRSTRGTTPGQRPTTSWCSTRT